MPAYEFTCKNEECTVEVFENRLTFAEFDLLPRDEAGSVTMACVCGEMATKVFSAYGNISSSDDPSFSCTPGKSDFQRNSANRESNSFGDMKHDGWVEREVGNKGQWEYAD